MSTLHPTVRVQYIGNPIFCPFSLQFMYSSEHLERLCTLFFYTVQHEHMHPGVKYNKTQLSTAIHQKSTLENAWFVPRTTATRVKHCMASIRRALWEMLDLFLKPLPQQSSTAVQQRALWEMLDMFLEPLPQESSTFSQQRALWEMLDIFLEPLPQEWSTFRQQIAIWGNLN